MQSIHMPRVDWRYWVAIVLASVFGTNLGDLYANESGLSVYAGVVILAALAAGVFVAERRDPVPREIYYWTVILIIRTGATNIADYVLWELELPATALSIALAALIAGFGWASLRGRTRDADSDDLPATGAAYWIAMLSAGVFGTVVGDKSQEYLGQLGATLGLGALLIATLATWRFQRASRLWIYWIVVAVARTAGTAMGDLLSEGDSAANIGLPLATAVTGAAFVAVLAFWPRGGRAASATAR